jgi:hypothetical protein
LANWQLACRRRFAVLSLSAANGALGVRRSQRGTTVPLKLAATIVSIRNRARALRTPCVLESRRATANKL